MDATDMGLDDEDIVMAMIEDIDEGEDGSLAKRTVLLGGEESAARPRSAADVERDVPEPGAWREVTAGARTQADGPSHALTPHNDRYRFSKVFEEPLLQTNQWSRYRTAALGVAALGAIMAIWAGRADALASASSPPPTHPALLPLGAFLILAGSLAALLIHFLGRPQWGATTLATQTEEQRLAWQRMALAKKIATATAWTFAVSMFVLVVAYQFASGATLLVIGAAGTVVAGAALVAWGLTEARRPALRRAFLQTGILAMLEEEGLGPQGAMDPRVAQVLEAMDTLLADLPDSAIQRFLETDVSNTYLDLLEEARSQHE